MDKQCVYYDEMNVPCAIRIVSKKLCMDHTFVPLMAKETLSVDDIKYLSESTIADDVYVCFSKESLYWKEKKDDVTIMHQITGWKNVSQLEIHDIKELYQSDDYYRQKYIWE